VQSLAVQSCHDPSPDPQRIVLVHGKIVGQARDPRVHLGAT